MKCAPTIGDLKALRNLLVSFRNLLARRNEPLPYPDLDENELSPEMLEKIGEMIFQFLDERDKRGFRDKLSDEQCWLVVRSWFGLKCSHPRMVPYGRGAWRCVFCESVIVRTK
ncbi:MAG: hypothetical protein DRG40_00365 [Deltaproteobacteria bacterium]|nr:MAG: hypothetical protein DRG40_00365 [Deltaproteobacteria bacterium]